MADSEEDVKKLADGNIPDGRDGVPQTADPISGSPA